MADTTRWGAIQWALWPGPPLPLLSVLSDGVVEAGTLFSSQLLADRFYRLNPSLPEPIALDEFGKIPDLVSLAERFHLEPAAGWIERNWFDAH